MADRKRALKSDETAKLCFKSNQGKENEGNPPKRRRTRTTRNTRSLAEDDIPTLLPKKKQDKKFSYVKIRADIKYYTGSTEIAQSSDNLLQWVEKQPSEGLVPIAFDMKFRFSHKPGLGKSAVILMCAEKKCCFVFQLTKVRELPDTLVALLKHKRVHFYGVKVKDKFQKLRRDFPEVNSDGHSINCLDLSVWCNAIFETSDQRSLEKLANYLIRKSIVIYKGLRKRRWHVIPLDKKTLKCAAINVYTGQLIYQELKKLAKTKEANQTAFREQQGEEAFRQLKALGVNFLN